MKSHYRQPADLDDPRVVAALDEYLAALENGQKLERRAFLAKHAEIADALAECLEGMEALHDASSASHSAGRRDFASPDWQPGTPLGDYRILREIGRGGMGVVYEAEQLSLGRRIALKVLPFALTLDPRQLQRFKNEARAAAQLHHQHIVPVYAVGSERGVHFYAMQYIEGQSLAEVIHELREQARTANGEPPVFPGAAQRGDTTGPYLAQSTGIVAAETGIKPTASLATAYSANSSGFYRTVARLGIQAAEALQHAHEYGVVHRDVKPGNLMVDAHGHLWVTDFGLAQFQADAGLTQTGDLLGTLRYMSPEQASGQRLPLDQRTDVYSLGATLYELLTLHPPFDGGDRQTLLHQILNDEPRSPRAFQKAIPVELETIILKALAKSPAERYATAREMADDLSRFLDYQPIRARRATPMQRIRKWARRHPSVVWAAVVLCLLTAAGSLISAGMIRREQINTEQANRMLRQEQSNTEHANHLLRREQEKTKAALQEAEKRAREAEQQFHLTREAVEDMFKLCEEELNDKPFLNGLRQRVLEDFLVYYQKLIDQRRDNSASQTELSANLARAQRIRDDLVILQGASRHGLLKEKAVLENLKLTPEQGEQIKKLTRSLEERGRGGFGMFPQMSPEERREKLQSDVERARATETEIERYLTPGQQRRLRQIDLQRKGPLAFDESDVIAALKLTAKQRETIHDLHWKAMFHSVWAQSSCPPPLALGPGGSPKLHGKGGPSKPPEPHGKGGPPKPPEPPTATVQRIVQTVLSPEQQQRWNELTGEPAPPPPPPPPGYYGGGRFGRGGHNQPHREGFGRPPAP